MLRWTLLLLCAWLAGCASPPAVAPPEPGPLLRDAAFAPPAAPIDREAVFAMSEPMRAYLAQNANALRREGDTRHALIDMLYKRRQLQLEYDGSLTRTASQAFEARAGNCLSLVLMTASFARELGLPVRFQRVFVDETWSRVGNLSFASGHLNLALDFAPPVGSAVHSVAPSLIVDFLPGVDLARQRAQVVGESTVLAMFMNNRAAERLALGDVDGAYWFAREAVLADPRYTMAFNTLGVIYQRRGLVRDAERLYNEVLAREPENPKVLGNLVGALRDQGRSAEAEALARRLAAIEPFPPFHFFDAGIAAMKQGQWQEARELFERELRREPYFHETHFRLAQVAWALGDLKSVKRHLELARQSSTTPTDSSLYSAKLDKLKAIYR